MVAKKRINSKQKGKRGELELVHYLKSYGVEARRGVQYEGSSDSPDVISDLEDIYIECKNTQNTSFYKWMEKAEAEADKNQTPVIFHRKNAGKWMVFVDAEYFMKLRIKQ